MSALESTPVKFASTGGDGSVYLWNLDDEEPMQMLEGHAMRAARLAFHPSGRFLGTTRYALIVLIYFSFN
jgi:U4/U6 small nuclear ribonucleoprotein PRP4